MELVEEALMGSDRAVAQIISMVENELPGWMEVMKQLYPHTGNAYLVGFTGPTGSGKSTLIDEVALRFCNQGCRVGIIAIDPSSPFTGGALLGDRIRMRGVTNRGDVFIRSLGTRGGSGGISNCTSQVIKVLDACGKEFIMVETIGIGQDEVEIAQIVDTSIVISVPGLGDDIQTFKAGVMEIGDIFVVNKADREGADKVVSTIKAMLELGAHGNSWEKPVLKTVAKEGKGIDALVDAIVHHRSYLKEHGLLEVKHRERIEREIIRLLEYRITQYVHKKMTKVYPLKELVAEIDRRERDPYSCVESLLGFLEEK